LITSLKKILLKHGYLLLIALVIYTISYIITNYWAYDSTPVKVENKLQSRLISFEHELNKVIDDTSLLKLLIVDSSVDKKLQLTNKPFGLFVYTLTDDVHTTLSYWNTNVYSVTQSDIAAKDGYYFSIKKNGEQEIVKKTITLNGKTAIVIGIIPIKWGYFINNKYLHEEFDGFLNLSEQYEITNDKLGYPIVNSNGNTIYKIKLKEGHHYFGYDAFTIILRIIVVLLLMLFINRVCEEVITNFGKLIGITSLTISLLIIRYFFIQFNFPFELSRLPLFDPSIYASNFINPSLGHLFVNSVLLLWMVTFYKFNTINYTVSTLYKKVYWLSYVNIALMVVVVFTIASIMESIVTDSRISFDVTHFFSLTIFSVLSFITLAFLAFSFYHLSHIIFRPVFALNIKIHSQIIAAVIISLLYSSTQIGKETILNIVLLFWLIGFILLINWRKADCNLLIETSTFFIFWILIFTVSITMIINFQNRRVDFAQRKKIAERLALQNDINGENVLAIAVSNISNSILAANYDRLKDEISNKQIKDSILNENFTGYLNRFETSVYTFNQFYEPLFNEDTSLNYAAINAIISVRSKPTALPNLFVWDNNTSQITYIYSVPIGNSDNPLGYFMVVARTKKYKSEALYPVLFSQQGDEDNWSSPNKYPQAIYINGKLTSKYNQYEFPLKINVSQLLPYDFKVINNEDFEELWFNGGNNKTVIVVKENEPLIEIATLFAYLFLTLLVVTGFIHLINLLLHTNFAIQPLKRLFKISIQTQINMTVIFISLFSFIIIGASTISFFTNRFDNINRQRLSATIETIANEIGGRLQQLQIQLPYNNGISLYDAGYFSNFEKDITDISEVHNVDVNFYGLNGNLIASTQPHIYSKQLLNSKINPTAFYHLMYDKRSHFVQTENIGSLRYLSMYLPVLDEKGKTYAYINIPFLNSQVELNQEISNFIATLINLNALIFLIAGVIAFIITERIVASFTLIANKMKEVNIGKKNEAINWDKDDEIGELVTEYNKMVLKLEVSAKALAKSEREGAWKEMAKQVAHEIKNPLTPMKLSIQYLQRAIDNDLPNVKELSQRVALTLIDQIEELSKIASDFSQFANIDNAKIERLDISYKIESIVQLYKQTESVIINLNTNDPIYIMGDKTQINRLFTNLIKNAIESIDENQIAVIDINQSIKNNFVIIMIKDNGKGIPIEIAESIFQPNFTTKSSGTGLGLAMCKGIVEKMEGKISFSTEPNKGTTFTIELPLV